MRQKILYSLGVCALALTFALPQVASARNLYSIIVADTNDGTIGTSVEADFNHVRKKMQEVANYIGLDLKEISIKGNSNKPSLLLESLRNAPITNDDIVVFYYSGHGYRTNNKGSSPWPNLYFSTPDQGVKYETIITSLNNKHPRFLLTMVDVCNSFIPDNGAPPLVTRDNFSAAQSSRIKTNYQHLFLESVGSINITSSSAGEKAYGYNDGGLYTNAFLNTLTSMVNSKSTVQWNAILDRAASLVNQQEHPYFELHI